jgi:predicted amidophosphoribosyltransferase
MATKPDKIIRCPYCMEEIAPGALICKHCGSHLKTPKRKKKTPFWRNTYMLGVYSGVVFMILMIYLYNRVF